MCVWPTTTTTTTSTTDAAPVSFPFPLSVLVSRAAAVPLPLPLPLPLPGSSQHGLELVHAPLERRNLAALLAGLRLELRELGLLLLGQRLQALAFLAQHADLALEWAGLAATLLVLCLLVEQELAQAAELAVFGRTGGLSAGQLAVQARNCLFHLVEVHVRVLQQRQQLVTVSAQALALSP